MPRDFIENRLHNNALSSLAITLAHTYRLAHLPFHHKDPFDRLLELRAKCYAKLVSDGLLGRRNRRFVATNDGDVRKVETHLVV